MANKEDKLANYINTIDRLEDAGIDISNMKPNMTDIYGNPSGQTSGQTNKDVILQSGWNTGYQPVGKFGRETRKQRILRKGSQLRKWFSPLRGK